MKGCTSYLVTALEVSAFLQLGIALLNLFLVRLLHWEAEVRRMSLLLCEVFHVHAWFISVTLAFFAVMTWRFSGEMAGGATPMASWLAGGIGVFWAIRAAMQVTYYSSSHWYGQPGRTVVHVLLLFIYGGFTTVYLAAAFRAGS